MFHVRSNLLFRFLSLIFTISMYQFIRHLRDLKKCVIFECLLVVQLLSLILECFVSIHRCLMSIATSDHKALQLSTISLCQFTQIWTKSEKKHVIIECFACIHCCEKSSLGLCHNSNSWRCDRWLMCAWAPHTGRRNITSNRPVPVNLIVSGIIFSCGHKEAPWSLRVLESSSTGSSFPAGSPKSVPLAVVSLDNR